MKDPVPHNARFYYPLVMLNIIFAVMCIPTAGKTIDIFGIPLSVSIFYFPFVYVVADILTEVYGYAAARRALWYSVILQGLTAGVFQLVAIAPPSVTMTNNDAYVLILSQAPIIVGAGLIATFIGDIANNYVLAKMKVRTAGRHMAARFIASTFVGEFLNTLIFYVLALVLTGIIPLKAAVGSIILATLAKIAVEIVFIPLTTFVANRLKVAESMDVFDTNTDFNPVKF